MYHITNLQENEELSEEIFPNILTGETILFLGAGASVNDDKNYLSCQLMEHHKAATGRIFQTDSIVEYVDVLSRNQEFHRNQFDDIVERRLRSLTPNPFHSTIARLPWKEIITTNLDLLVEKAFDKAIGTPDQNKTLKPIRTVGDYNYNPANDEIKFIKLNGCISDRNKYPFLFSTTDFNSANRFYKVVLSSLENMSPRIQFLSIGYSFSDKFGKYLIDRFDRYNPRRRRDILLVDPFVQPEMLPFLENQNIKIIQTTGADFFEKFETWEKVNEESLLKKKPISFRKKDRSPIILSQRLINKLGNSISQIHSDSMYEYFPPKRFYSGERPSYNVIKQNHDVIRSNCLEKVIQDIFSLLKSEEWTLPIVALTGSYGVGKTTFCYRLAHSILDSTLDVAIFEILDPQSIRDVDLMALISATDAENVILLFDECEVDSIFKTMMELRYNLSTQVSGPSILMLVPIRENILQKLTNNRYYKNLHLLEIDPSFNHEEATDLINKLDDSNVISPRDENERRSLASRIVTEYKGDAFVSLLSIVTQGHHEKILRSAFDQLSKKAKESFLFTSLLYRYKISMPSGLLMKLVSKNWNDFRKDVMEYDARGILVQEENKGPGGTPDLYFRTRHSVISERLIEIYLKDLDKRFIEYRKIISKLTQNPYNSDLIINLLKAMIYSDEFPQPTINKFFDLCASEFSSDPHFNLHYANNLQHRGDEKSIRHGIDRIIEAESYLDHRNHRLIHRRAVLNFWLARLQHEGHVPLSTVQPQVDEARELFEIKLLMDPCSIYSYREYLQFEIWYLDNLVQLEESKIRSIIAIENLIDRAKRHLHAEHEIIANLEARFRRKHGLSIVGDGRYDEYINELYENPEMKPYALILFYFVNIDNDDNRPLESAVFELEKFRHLHEVAKLLFRHYGHRLHREENISKLFDLDRSIGHLLRKKDPLQYHFFLGVAEAYSRRFQKFRNHMNQIRKRFRGRFHVYEFWRDDRGNPMLFEAVITLYRNRLHARVIDLQYNIPLFLKKNTGDQQVAISSRHMVKIRFYAGGMTAYIAKSNV